MMGRRLADTRAIKGQRREKGSSKKTDSDKSRIVMTGWNIPFIPDENDIVAWVKREKNGDNKRKPRRDEEVPEEAFRHMFSRCGSLENQMEFERESLVQRYRKHCQFGPLALEKTRPQQPEKPAVATTTTATTTTTKAEGQDKVPSTPSGGLRYPRSCKSAEVPGTPKISVFQQMGRGDDDIESLIPTRSHSVIDDSQLRAYGLTLPPDEKTARLLELAGKFIARAETTTTGVTPPKLAQSGPRQTKEEQDEGYDSKISSNDADALDEDEEGSRVVQLDAQSEKMYPESELRDPDITGGSVDTCEATSSWANPSRVTPSTSQVSKGGVGKLDLSRPQPQTMPQYQAPTDSGRAAIAKLMYSQRDKNLYERTPNRRMRQNGFRYAGKEQSRLMETSLNHITPGYLSLHQFAYLSNFVQYPLLMNEQQNQQQQEEQQPQQLLENEIKQQQEQSDQSVNINQSSNGVPSRTIVMRKICLQDSNNPDSNHFSLEAKSRSSEVSSESPNQETISEQTNAICSMNGNGAQSELTHKLHSVSSCHQVANAILYSTQDDVNSVSLKPKVASTSNPAFHEEGDAHSTRQRQMSGNSCRETQNFVPKHHNAPDSVIHGHRRTSQTTIPGLRSRNVGSGLRSERLSTTCFPVADLLPAVEKSLRRKGRKAGLSRQHQQLLYRSQSTLLDGSIWKQTEQPVTASYPDSLNYSSTLGGAGVDVMDEEEVSRSPRLQLQPGDSIFRTSAGVSLLVHKSHGPRGFRPHNSLSPLQRAKDIVNRRLHGHITHQPDGSETVQVTSPQYQSSRMDRINSASRRLDRIINGTWKRES